MAGPEGLDSLLERVLEAEKAAKNAVLTAESAMEIATSPDQQIRPRGVTECQLRAEIFCVRHQLKKLEDSADECVADLSAQLEQARQAAAVAHNAGVKAYDRISELEQQVTELGQRARAMQERGDALELVVAGRGGVAADQRTCEMEQRAKAALCTAEQRAREAEGVAAAAEQRAREAGERATAAEHRVAGAEHRAREAEQRATEAEAKLSKLTQAFQGI